MVIVSRLESDKACPVFECRCEKCGAQCTRIGHRKDVERGTSCRACYLAAAEEKRLQLVCVISEATEVIGRAPTYAEVAARCVCSRTHIFSEVKKLQAANLVEVPEKRMIDPVTGFGYYPAGIRLTAAGHLVAARALRTNEGA